MKTTKPTTTGTSNTTSPSKPDSLFIFEVHGVSLSDTANRSGQYVGDCIFCDSPQHFFCSEKSKNKKLTVEGPFFSCVKCGAKGNKYTFLKKLYEHFLAKTSANAYNRLSLKRKKFPVAAFSESKIAYNPITHRWMLPTFNTNGGVTNIHTYDGEPGSPLMGSPGCAQHLYGLEDLKKEGPVMICYSADTEILTESGWKLFPNLLPSDKVAAFDTLTNLVQFEVPQARQKFWHSGEMVHYKAKWSELLVTPNHRMIYRWPGKLSWNVKTADKVGRGTVLPVAGIMVNDNVESPTPEQARLLVSFVGDGNIEKRGFKLRWVISRTRKIRKLRELLNDLKIPFDEREEPSRDGYKVFLVDRNHENAKFILEHCPEKTWTGKEPFWSLAARAAFLEELKFWDGDHQTGKLGSRYFTSIKSEADIVTRVAAVTGYGAQVRKVIRVGVTYIGDREIPRGTEYVVNLIRKESRQLSNKPIRTEYTGHVYCATVSTGALIVRRKGKVVVSGNCEGHWDAIAMKHLLKRCQEQAENWSILAAPGCTTFPESDLKYLQGRDLYFPFDNDEPGHKGMQGCIAKAAGHAKSVHAIDWPPNRFADGYDLTDLVRESGVRPDHTFKELLSWHHVVTSSGEVSESTLPKLNRTKIEEVIADFKETGVHVYPGFKDAMIISLAIIESIVFKGEPLWAYLIGISGAGKSLILDATLAAEGVLYRTSITHRSLISGYKGEEGMDPSLMAKLPGRALVVKDYSNVLSLPSYEQDQLFSILREAYDGRIYKDYGNGVIRQYPLPGSEHDDCKFSFVAGVTPDIYTRDNTALGERFLRFHIPRTAGDDLRAITTAMDDSWRSHQRARRRAASVASFLGRYGDQNKDELPKPGVPSWYRERLIALAQFVGYCRSHVARTKEDLDYDPAVESGTRMAKQLLKLSMSIARIMGRKSCDQDVYRLVRKVAWDTSHSKRRAIYMRFRKHGEGEATVLSRTTGYALSTIHRQLRDMRDLGMLKKAGTKLPGPDAGRPKIIYELTEKAKEIFDTAKIKEV